MDPARKRKTRLFVTLGVALLLATALIYTSFSASTVAKTPSELLTTATPGKSYELTGKVAEGSVKEVGDDLEFKVRDRAGTASIPVKYSGTVPDPFREGREVIVTGVVENGVLVAEPSSLVTKCPSKFSNKTDS
ncbi:MAG: cytochrome c maturation protein CcmE [Solirubrobacterales bacterium]